MDKNSHVRIEIFNIRGQKIRSLVDNAVTKGWHTIQWNGKDQNANALPSGVYYLRMTTDGKSFTYKTTLMK